jgi:hypothetical protein
MDKDVTNELLALIDSMAERIEALELAKNEPDAINTRGCPGRCCKWMGVAQVDNYAASPRLARLEWSARVVARAAFRASRASLSFGNCL